MSLQVGRAWTFPEGPPALPAPWNWLSTQGTLPTPPCDSGRLITVGWKEEMTHALPSGLPPSSEWAGQSPGSQVTRQGGV